MGALDRFENVQGLTKEPDGAAGLAEVLGGVAEIVQRSALTTPVPDLPRDRELLLVKFDGAAGLAEVPVGGAEIAQRSAATACRW
jgi:hypothetical protein